MESIDKTKRCGQPRRRRQQPQEQRGAGEPDPKGPQHEGAAEGEGDDDVGEQNAPMEEGEEAAGKGKDKA